MDHKTEPKPLEDETFQAIQRYLKNFEQQLGLEFHPFKIGWYNAQVKKNFHLNYDFDTLAFCVVSTPSMFEKAFLPLIQSIQHSGEESLLVDPLDQSMTHHLMRITEHDILADYKIHVLQDFEVHTNRRPKVLVQTAGHVSGAAYYYQRQDVSNQPWQQKEKIFGVSVHPKYSGWFAFRGVLVFSTCTVPFLKQTYATDVLANQDNLKVDLLTKFNKCWQDWSFRDVPVSQETYSPSQREYFLTQPADRFKLIKSMLERRNLSSSAVMSSLAIKRVLISDKVDASCKDILIKNGIEVDLKPGRSVDELKADIKNYDALIVRSATKVTPEIIELGSNLKLIGRAGTGVDNIDLPSASKNGVLVMNTPGGNTISAVEHTCALISAVARHVGQGHASMKEGKWERSKFMGCELLGKTLAIVGLGRIGREVATRMQSYGMKTIGFDPLVSPEEAAQYGIEWMEVEKLWPLTDFVTVHTPLIPQTRGLVNAKVFATKPGIRVVNVARGGIIDEADLLAALNNGTCGGAALDVFVTEPPTGVSLELAKHPKVVCTPHLGASTSEAQLRVAGEIAEQIVDAVNGKPMVGLVNAPALAESANPVYKPWLELATKLGQIVSAANNTPSKIEVVTSGSTLSSVARLMMVAASYGIAKSKNPNANMISCGELLKEQGIAISCKHDKSAASDNIAIFVGDNSFVGMLNGDVPLLVKAFGNALASPVSLSGNLVVSTSSTLNDFMQSLNGTSVTSISTGTSGSVMVASITGTVAQLQAPLQFIQL